MAVTPLVDLDAVENKTAAVRAIHKARARATPKIRLWTNNPDGSAGLLLRGMLADTIAGSFPKQRNEAATYLVKMRLDHHLAKWLISIPNDPEAKKNVVITVDHMGLQWSGLLHHWTAKKDSDGILYLEVTFIDDLQFLDFLLGPPNPALPIPIFQFPRVLPIFGPTAWAVGFLILINLMRKQGNWYNPPDDPFDWQSWQQSFDWTQWQAMVSAPAMLNDPSLWTLLATRMDKVSTTIADALDDAQLVIRPHRIMTVDGETPADFGLSHMPSCRNGMLVFQIVDASGYYSPLGNVFGGSLFDGFRRSVIQFATGFVETYLGTPESQTIWPDEYYQRDFWRQKPGYPWICIRDSKWSQIQSAELTWNPATAVSVIAGGDNQFVDQLAELLIQSVGNILGYFALGGFSSAGDIAATVIMPFLQGPIAAWLEWKNLTRAQQLGWVHLWEIYQQGAEQNAWSLAGLAALRAGFKATESQSCHQFELNGSGPIYPGLHFDIGDRISSTWDKVAPNVVFTEHVEQLTLAWDYSSGSADTGHAYEVTVGKNTAGMSTSERSARLLSKALETMQNVGVHLVS